MLTSLANYWEKCLEICEMMLRSLIAIGRDFFVDDIGTFYWRYIGIGSDFVDRILDVLGLNDLTMIGLLFGMFGIYICYQFATWVFNLVT